MIYPVFSQNLNTWENCTSGMEGFDVNTSVHNMENYLYLYTKNTFYTSNNGKSWQPFKQLDYLDYNNQNYVYKQVDFITKYNNVYIVNFDFISTDQQKWKAFKHIRPTFSDSFTYIDNYIMIATDSTLIFRISWSEKDDSAKYVRKLRTCISKGIGKDLDEIFVFDTIPAANDYQTTSEEKYFKYFYIDRVVYAVYYTSKLSYFKHYYYSTDYGWSWQKHQIPEIQGGVKSIVKINGRLWILSPFALWRPRDDGSYEKIVDEQFDNFNTDFFIEHKGMIYAQALDSSNHKPILVRSKDNGISWEKVGKEYFTIRQLFSINGELVARSAKGVLASTNDGETWEERQQGLYDSPDYFYQGPWKRIVKVGENEYITAPRNNLYNTMMKSYDGGRTWKRKYVIDSIGYTEYTYTGNLYNFTFHKNKYGLFAVDRGSNKTYISYDQGDTWEKYSDVSAFYRDNDKNMYERGDTLFFLYEYYLTPHLKYVYYSLDTGQTWVMYDSLFLQKLPEKSEFLFVRDGQYYSFRYSDLSIFKSIDDGRNWNYERSMNLKLPDTLNYKILFSTVTSKDTIIIFIVDIPSGISFPVYISKDFGRSFVQLQVPYINGNMRPYTYKFIYLNEKLFLLLLDSRKKLSSLLMYDDKNNEWINIAPNLDGNVITDILAVEDYLYISTTEGLFRIKTEPVSVGEQNKIVTLKPIELYPNPASEKIRIQNNYYNLTNLQVLDIYGREQKISNNTGEEFDVSHLQSGIYIVKLTFDGSWYVAKKFVKM